MRIHQPRIGGLAYRHVAVALLVLLFVALLPRVPERGESQSTQEWSGYLPHVGQATSQDVVVVPTSPHRSGASTITAAEGVVAAALSSGIAFYETIQGVPQYLGRTESRGTAVAALAIDGDLLYSAERELSGGRLVVYDWLDTDEIVQVGGVNLTGRPQAMTAPVSNRLYIGGEDGEVTVVDTSRAPSITAIGSFNAGGAVTALVVTASAPGALFAAVTDGSGVAQPFTFRGYDVSDPNAPLLQNTAALASPGTSIDVNTGLAVVGAASGGVSLIQLPSFQIVGAVTSAAAVADVALSGTTLFLSDSAFTPVGVPDAIGVRAYDVSDPAAPTTLGTVAIPRQAGEFALASGYLYVATPLGVEVVDVSSPAHLERVGRAGDWRHWFEGGVFVGNGNAIVTDVFGKLELVETVDFAITSQSTITDTGTAVYAVNIDGDYAYAMGDNFLMSVDVSVPAQPVVRGAVAPLLEMGDPLASAVAVSENVVFAGGMWGLAAVDVTDPHRMTVLGEFADLEFDGPRDLSVQDGELAVTTEGLWQLRTIDMVSPLSSPIVAEIEVAGRALVRSGNNIYVGGLGLLHVYDTAQPPNLVASMELPGSVADMVAVGDVLYVAYYELPMHLIDISNPMLPNIVGTVSAVPYARALALDGPRLLVIGGDYLRLLNVQEPTRPMPMGRRLLPG